MTVDLFPSDLFPTTIVDTDRDKQQDAIVRVLLDNSKFNAETLAPVVAHAVDSALLYVKKQNRRPRKEELACIGVMLQSGVFGECDFEYLKPLDTILAGHPVDMKCTCVTNWMVPPQSFGHWGLLWRIDLVKRDFVVGILPFDATFLTNGFNRDAKHRVNKDGMPRIHWMLTGSF